jgi:hypothetical protein
MDAPYFKDVLSDRLQLSGFIQTKIHFSREGEELNVGIDNHGNAEAEQENSNH